MSHIPAEVADQGRLAAATNYPRVDEPGRTLNLNIAQRSGLHGEVLCAVEPGLKYEGQGRTADEKVGGQLKPLGTRKPLQKMWMQLAKHSVPANPAYAPLWSVCGGWFEHWAPAKTIVG